MKNVVFNIALIVLGIACSANIMAQESLTVDHIYTNRGDLWKGTIIEITPEGYYVVETLSGLTLHLHKTEVKNVRQVWSNGGKPAKPYSFKETGFYQTVELNFSGNSTGPGLGATYSAGHRFSRWIGVGGGSGIIGYNLGQGLNVIPLFIEARGYFAQKKVSPYYALRVGYGFALKDANYDIESTKGGYLFNPQLGIRFGGGSNVSYYMGVGLHYQQATYTYEYTFSEETRSNDYLFKRIELKFGITF